MIIIFALIGALVVGLILGLTYRGFVMVGDRRQLSIMTEQMHAEHRMSMATNDAIARMRAAVRANLRS